MWYPETEGPLWKLFVIMSVESSLSDELTGRSKISNFSFLETSFAIVGDSKNSVSIRKESVWRLWEWFLSGRHFSFWPDLVWDVRSDSCWKVDDDEKHSAADRNICFNFIYPKTKLRRDLHLVPHLSLALTLYTELRKIGLNDILDYIDYFLLYWLFYIFLELLSQLKNWPVWHGWPLTALSLTSFHSEDRDWTWCGAPLSGVCRESSRRLSWRHRCDTPRVCSPCARYACDPPTPESPDIACCRA